MFLIDLITLTPIIPCKEGSPARRSRSNLLKAPRVPTTTERSNKRQKQTSEAREKGIVVIKRQLSVHIDFPVLCGVRLELSCSVPEGLGRQCLLCQEEGGGALTTVGVS